MNLNTFALMMLLAAQGARAADNPAVARLLRDADKALAAKPGSVMDKTLMPPGGDKHDYLSLAPYSWPDPAKPDGLPWINRDGEVNPASRAGTDHDAFGLMCSQVETLALAYHVTRRDVYAAGAVTRLRVWFLDPATRMNPHLEYGQGVPGRNTGRGTGIIDTVPLIRVVEGLRFLRGSPAYTPDVEKGLQAWIRRYLDWLLTSENGRYEAAAANNHGSWYLAQTAAYAWFLGDTAQVRKSAEAGRQRIASQIEPDGRQPLELKRTKSYSYSIYNLEALFTLAELGRRVDVDLFSYHTSDGRSLRAAIGYMAPYFNADKHWPDQQIKEVKHPDDGMAALLRRAAIAYREPKYEALLNDPALAASRFQFLWPPP